MRDDKPSLKNDHAMGMYHKQIMIYYCVNEV